MTDIVERLRKVESSTYETGSRTGALCGTTNWYRNPDGPEAADEIERLRARLAEAERLLGDARETGDPCVLHEDTQRRIDAFLAADKGTGMRGFRNVDDPSLLPPPTYPPESESEGN